MRILSWNVNGIRASEKVGFLDWLYEDSPDILCVQETKAKKEDLSPALQEPVGYNSYFAHSTKKKGYSGVAVYTKVKPKEVRLGIGKKHFDEEGRVITLYYKDFVLINGYWPNSGMKGRLEYKLEFNDAILEYIENFKKYGDKIVFCGDMNVAREDIDIARVKENEGRAGFTEEERAWADEVISLGYVDSFRYFYPEKIGAYTYWDTITRARDRNVGWRIDYIFISPNILQSIKNASILSNIRGSDHCPISIDIDI